MEWTQFAIFALGVFGLFIWNRTESRQNIRYMDDNLEANRELLREVHRETQGALTAMRKETHDLITAIREDIKDFHGRLCSIEERRSNHNK